MEPGRGRVVSVFESPVLSALFLFSSAIHEGCEEVGLCRGLGDSGLFNALSNQLDLVGLHRRGSIVLDGLVGMWILSTGSAFGVLDSRVVSIVGALGVASSSDSFSPCRDVGLLELGVVDPGRAMLCGRLEPSPVLLLDVTESARLRPGGPATLHRLTLSDLFIIALCTKPPMPFVGELERELERVGETRPAGDAFNERSVARFSSLLLSN